MTTTKTRRPRGPTDRSAAQTYLVSEYAKLLGIGRDQCYAAVKSGEIPSIKVGERYLIPKALGDRMLGKDAPKQSAGAA